MATSKQIKQIHALLPREITADKERKGDLIAMYTEDVHKRSTKDLTERQAWNLIHNLQDNSGIDKCDLQRKKILSICHEMGWEVESGKIDWQRLNNWLSKYGYLHKGLNEYSAKELPKLVTQFENLQRSSYGQD